MSDKWKIIKGSCDEPSTIVAPGRIVCQAPTEYNCCDDGDGYVDTWTDHGWTDENDPQLIAAAPELLEACKKAMRRLRLESIQTDYLEDAIKKAEGNS